MFQVCEFVNSSKGAATKSCVVSGSFKLMPPAPMRYVLLGEPTLTRGVAGGLRTLIPLHDISAPGPFVQLAAVRIPLPHTAISELVGTAPPTQAVVRLRVLALF